MDSCSAERIDGASAITRLLAPAIEPVHIMPCVPAARPTGIHTACRHIKSVRRMKRDAHRLGCGSVLPPPCQASPHYINEIRLTNALSHASTSPPTRLQPASNPPPICFQPASNRLPARLQLASNPPPAHRIPALRRTNMDKKLKKVLTSIKSRAEGGMVAPLHRPSDRESEARG